MKRALEVPVIATTNRIANGVDRWPGSERCSPTRHRVVVTGMGLVSPLGNTLEEFWQKLIAGCSAVKPVTRFDSGRFACKLAAEVDSCPLPREAEPYRHELKRLDRFVRYALSASGSTLSASRFPLARLAEASGGIYLGVSMGGLGALENGFLRQEAEGPERTDPYLISATIPNTAAGMIALVYGFDGPQYTLVSGCSSGIQAIGEAVEAIRSGRFDWALAGGAEAAITPITFSGFQAMGILSLATDPQTAPRPFDQARDGMIVGEGAGVLMLESRAAALARGAPILAEVTGYSTTSVTSHAFFSCSAATARCMELALADAGLDPAELDCIYAHAGGLASDDNELQAMRRIWNGHGGKAGPALTSIKGHLGYSFGAGGPLDVIAAILALAEQQLSPTLHFSNLEPELSGFDIVDQPRNQRLRTSLINSFGLGGVNACLLVSEAGA